MEPKTGDYFDPAKATFIAPLGVEHFFDAFALEHKRDIRVDAAIAWPLARLTIPLSGFSKHLERLRSRTGACLPPHSRIATLLRQVLDHPTKVLYDPENEVLFLPQFWLFPIYRELLNTASRNRPSRDSEVRRAASGLAVKVLCNVNDSMSGGKGPKKGSTAEARRCPGQVPGSCSNIQQKTQQDKTYQPWKINMNLKLTWHLKMDGWNASFLLGWPIFRCYVSFTKFINQRTMVVSYC